MVLLELQFRGLRQVERRIDELVRRHPRAAQDALMDEAEIEMLEMKERTPVNVGTLRDSGRVEPFGTIGIKWIFGGAAEAYAAAVHENLEAFHGVGQAKFVESVVMEFIPNAAARIGRRWAAGLGLS